MVSEYTTDQDKRQSPKVRLMELNGSYRDGPLFVSIGNERDPSKRRVFTPGVTKPHRKKGGLKSLSTRRYDYSHTTSDGIPVYLFACETRNDLIQ